MSTVIVGVDNSDSSTRAVKFAAKQCLRNRWKVVVLHVIPWSPYSFQTPSENEHRHRERKAELAAARKQVLEPMVAILDRAGVANEARTIHGKPSDTILDLADEVSAVHIIIGRTGDGGLREAVFGSVASRVVQHATIPVTVVP